MISGGGSLDEPLLVWNGMVAHVPALVVRAATLREVAGALAFAHDHGLQLRIEEGGEGNPQAADERAVTIDVSSAREP